MGMEFLLLSQCLNYKYGAGTMLVFDVELMY